MNKRNNAAVCSVCGDTGMVAGQECPVCDAVPAKAAAKQAAPSADDLRRVQSLRYLRLMRPNDPWALTAIEPNGPTDTITARTPAEVRQFVEKYDGKWNQYYTLNPTRGDVISKPSKTDIETIEFLHADLDPLSGEPPHQARARYCAKLEGFEPRPTFVIDSGNGIQVLWRLAEPIVLGKPRLNNKGKPYFSPEDAAKIADAEARSRGLMERLGSKAGTQNIDRLLRLVGTINVPNRSKQRKGYVKRPATLLSHNDVAYPLDAFAPFTDDGAVKKKTNDKNVKIDLEKLPEVDVDALPIPGVTKELIRSGGDSGDRSADMLRAAQSMVHAGLDDNTIAAAIWHNPIGDHARDQPNQARAIERALASAHSTHYYVNTSSGFQAVEIDESKRPLAEGVQLEDFRSYMLMAGTHIYKPTGDMWPSSSIDACISLQPKTDAKGNPILDKDGKQKWIHASAWLKRHRPVEQVTWAPGLPQIVQNRLISAGGWIERKGVSCFNLYRPPTIKLGDGNKAESWVDHVRKVYPQETDHVIKWLAHRVQHPNIKPNHALVLGGAQGIGKDTILEPVKSAVGPWNFSEVSPTQVLGRFTGFLRSVILRVSEARDLGEVNRYAFYEHMKAYTAAPPDVLRVDEKHVREYAILNLVGIVITTNNKSTGLYLPEDDRRHFVAWSELVKDDFTPDYWKRLYGWYEDGGRGHVAAYLHGVDLSAFDAKAPPPKTDAWWEIVDAIRAPEESELADLLDAMSNPDVVTVEMITATGSLGVGSGIRMWLMDRKNRRQIPHRLEGCGYIPVRNPSAKDGLWKAQGKRQVVYGKGTLSPRDRIVAATRLCG